MSDVIILDIENGAGEHFHFEHRNKDCRFDPPLSKLIKPPSGAGSADNLGNNLIIFMVPK